MKRQRTQAVYTRYSRHERLTAAARIYLACSTSKAPPRMPENQVCVQRYSPAVRVYRPDTAPTPTDHSMCGVRRSSPSHDLAFDLPFFRVCIYIKQESSRNPATSNEEIACGDSCRREIDAADLSGGRTYVTRLLESLFIERY